MSGHQVSTARIRGIAATQIAGVQRKKQQERRFAVAQGQIDVTRMQQPIQQGMVAAGRPGPATGPGARATEIQQAMEAGVQRRVGALPGEMPGARPITQQQRRQRARRGGQQILTRPEAMLRQERADIFRRAGTEARKEIETERKEERAFTRTKEFARLQHELRRGERGETQEFTLKKDQMQQDFVAGEAQIAREDRAAEAEIRRQFDEGMFKTSAQHQAARDALSNKQATDRQHRQNLFLGQVEQFRAQTRIDVAEAALGKEVEAKEFPGAGGYMDSTVKFQPRPKSPSEMVIGAVYQTDMGPMRWTPQGGVLVQ